MIQLTHNIYFKCIFERQGFNLVYKTTALLKLYYNDVFVLFMIYNVCAHNCSSNLDEIRFHRHLNDSDWSKKLIIV